MSRDKTVVVTGATSGIGAAICQAFAAADVVLFPVGRNPRKLAATARRIPARQLAGTGLADLGSADDVAGVIEQIRQRLARLDVLVLAAGEYAWTELGDASADAFDSQFNINVRGPYLLVQGLMPLIAKVGGQIILVNSSIVRTNGEGVALFKATQHALQGLADSLRQDLNRHGVRVTSLYPGQTATPRMRRIYARRGARYTPRALLNVRDIAELAVALTRLPVTMEVTDIHVRSPRRY